MEYEMEPIPIILLMGLPLSLLIAWVVCKSISNGSFYYKGSTYQAEKNPFMWSFYTGSFLNFTLILLFATFGMSGYHFAPMDFVIDLVSRGARGDLGKSPATIPLVFVILTLSSGLFVYGARQLYCRVAHK